MSKLGKGTKESIYMAMTAQSQFEPATEMTSATPEDGLRLRASFPRSMIDIVVEVELQLSSNKKILFAVYRVLNF